MYAGGGAGGSPWGLGWGVWGSGGLGDSLQGEKDFFCPIKCILIALFCFFLLFFPNLRPRRTRPSRERAQPRLPAFNCALITAAPQRSLMSAQPLGGLSRCWRCWGGIWDVRMLPGPLTGGHCHLAGLQPLLQPRAAPRMRRGLLQPPSSGLPPLAFPGAG